MYFAFGEKTRASRGRWVFRKRRCVCASTIGSFTSFGGTRRSSQGEVSATSGGGAGRGGRGAGGSSESAGASAPRPSAASPPSGGRAGRARGRSRPPRGRGRGRAAAGRRTDGSRGGGTWRGGGP